jgi:hypothetical protein
VLDALLQSRALGAADLARLLVRHRPRRRWDARQGYDLQLTQYDDRGWRATSWGIELDAARRCGDLDSAVEGDRVWMTCTSGAAINRSADDD